MRLLLEWNGRFFHQVNGGIDGVVQPAYDPNTPSSVKNNDIDEGYKAIYATTTLFSESADAAITPPGKDNPVNHAPLRARCAKMLLCRGAGNTAGVNADVPTAWSPTRTRPLCPYAQVARYAGSGDVEDAGNFACR